MLLKVVTNGIRLDFLRFFWVRVSLRGFSLALLICFDTSSSLQPLFMNFSCSDLQLWWSSLSIEQIFLTL